MHEMSFSMIIYMPTTTTNNKNFIWPHDSWHAHVRTAGFYCNKVLLPTCTSWWHL